MCQKYRFFLSWFLKQFQYSFSAQDTLSSLQQRVETHKAAASTLPRLLSLTGLIHSAWINNLRVFVVFSSLMMASAELLRLVLVDEENGRSAVMNYLTFEANEQGKAKDTSKPKYYACGIENGLEYQYFSRYCTEVMSRVVWHLQQ